MHNHKKSEHGELPIHEMLLPSQKNSTTLEAERVPIHKSLKACLLFSFSLIDSATVVRLEKERAARKTVLRERRTAAGPVRASSIEPGAPFPCN